MAEAGILATRLDRLSPEKRKLAEALLERKRAAGGGGIIPRRPVQDTRHPVSLGQERLWFIDQMEPGSAAYHVPAALRFRGSLDLGCLMGALREIVRRHATLRTRFEEVGGQPVQVVEEPVRVPLGVVDLTVHPERSVAAAAKLCARAAVTAPLPLDRVPLFRVAVIRLRPDEHWVVAILHHMVSDGWSMGVFAREMSASYRSLLRGEPLALDPLPIQFTDYAAWQRERVRSGAVERQTVAWVERLEGLPPVLSLPTDRPRRLDRSAAGAQVDLEIPPRAAELVSALARKAGTTPFVVLLAVFQAFLGRVSGECDLAVGTPVAGRRPVETEPLIGFFVNTLVLRADLSADPSLRDLVRATHDTVLEADAGQEVPFERLVAALNDERSLAHAPLFQVLFVYQNTPDRSLAMPGLEVEALDLFAGATKFDLTLALAPLREGIAGCLEYSVDLFDRSSIRRLGSLLVELLEAALRDPEVPLAALAWLPPAARHQVVHEWSRPESTAPGTSVVERFKEWARLRPEAVAVVADPYHLTYRELERRSRSLARTLIGRGARPGERIGLCFRRSVELVVGVLGVTRTGGVYVPLDPEYPRSRLEFQVNDSGARFVVVDRSTAGAMPSGTVEPIFLDAEAVAGEGPPLPRPAGTDPLYVIYTSGSTGQPKGVVVSHRNVARLFDATSLWFRFGVDDSWTLFHSYAFDFSVWEIWGALLHGGRLVVVPFETSRDPEAFLDLLAAQRVTFLNQTPSAFSQLVRAEEARPAPEHLALRSVVFGGEALDPSSLAPWFRRHGEARPQLINMYGITETTVHVTYRPLGAVDAEGGSRSVIGRAIPDLALRVADPRLAATPIGVPGELGVGGDGVSMGYLGRPALTARRFVPDPWGPRPGSRLYRSGDLGRLLPDGDVEYLGRMDHQVKVRGFRVELGEIQAVLDEHPAVAESVVVARPDPVGNTRLLAYVVAPGAAATSGDLREHLAARLPPHMIPAAVELLDALPLTPQGKIDRRALPEPSQVRLAGDGARRLPGTREEKVLAEIWCEVLGLERVGVDDPFFSLGGDSISSLRVRHLAGRAGLDVSLRLIFRHQTIREIARHLRRVPGGTGEVIPALARFELLTPEERSALAPDCEDAYPATALQEGMLFHGSFDDRSTRYHNVSSVRLAAPFVAADFVAAVEDLLRRHPVLRTAFLASPSGRLLQVVAPRCDAPVAVEDLRRLPSARQHRLLEERFEEEIARRFHPARAPLLRFRVARLDEEHFQLFWAEHHAILDGWSVATMLADLFALYRFRSGRGERPADPPGQPGFREFVAVEERALASESQRAFWLGRLKGWPATDLPVDREEPAESESRLGRLEEAVEPRVAERLDALAKSAGLPLKTLLLAAHLRVLGLLTGRHEVATGLVSNGRLESADGDRTLGLFLNTVPFRFRLEKESWADLARRTHEAEVEVLESRRFPGSELRRMAGRELFRVTFNFIHFRVLAGVSGAELHVEGGRSFAETNFPLSVTFVREPQGSGLRVSLAHDPGQVSRGRVRSALGYLRNALEGLASIPAAIHSGASLLSAAERQQLLVEWPAAPAVSRPAETLDGFCSVRSERPEAVAVVAGDSALSHAELERRAAAVAGRLAAFGAGPERVVGVCLHRGLSLAVGLRAVLRSGAAYLPLDPDQPSERLSWMISDAGAVAVLCSADTRDLLDGRVEVPLLDVATVGAGADAAPEVAATPDRTAYVLYTSGSTGRPKGAEIPHRAIAAHMAWLKESFRLGGNDRVLQKTPISFDASVWELLVPLTLEATLVFAGPGEHRDPEALARILERQRVTALQGVPSLLRLLVTIGSLECASALRLLFSGGEALTRDLARRAAAATSAAFYNLYGLTEAAIDSTCGRVAELVQAASVPVGRPLSGHRVHLLDAAMAPVPRGVEGEVFVAGLGLARGYLRQPTRSAERFIPDPWGQPGARMHRTGDMGRWTERGEIVLVGRTDHQVKIRGHRIEPGEVEAVLVEHPALREAAVVAVPWGGSDPRLVAYYRPCPGAEVSEEDLRDHLRVRLPEPMVPSFFTALDAFPLTSSGKLDRRALQERETNRPKAPAPGLVSPRNPPEELVARVWEEVLGRSPVGVRDDFFSLGGHSLAALRVMTRLREVLDVDLPVRELFEAPTVERLARRLASRHAPPVPRITRVPREAPQPLSFAQERLWFLDQLAPGNPAYNLPVAFRSGGTLDAALVHRACRLVVERHEPLRTRFARGPGGPVQEVLANVPAPLATVDVSSLPPAVRERAARWALDQEARRPFDLAHEIPFRVLLVRVSPRDQVVLLSLHHIAADGRSLELLTRELGTIYRAVAEGREPELPDLPVRYSDFVQWQRRWLRDDVLARETAFWRDQLAGAPALLQLPSDRPRPPVQSHRGGIRKRHLDPRLVERLAAISSRRGATRFMAALAGFQALLARLTGQDVIPVGTPVDGRRESSLEPLVGLFLNTLVLAGDLRDDPSFDRLLRRTAGSVVEAFAHRDVPFERLVETLVTRRSRSHSPLFQVMLAFREAGAPGADRSASELTPVPVGTGAAKFDLTLFLRATERDLHCALEFDRDLFDPTTADRLLACYERLLTAATETPDLPISRLPLLDAGAWHQVAREWPDPDGGGAPFRAVHRLVQEQAERSPEAVALSCGGVHLTRAELDRRVAVLAEHLVRSGVGPGSRVGVLLRRDLDLVVGLLAVWRAGGAWVGLDPDYPDERLAFMIEDSDADLVLVQERVPGLRARAESAGARSVAVDRLPTPAGGGAADPEKPPVSPRQAAYVIYTSGTTGRPKGTVVDHGGLSRYVLWARTAYRAGADRGSAVHSSIGFDLTVTSLLVPLAAGGPVELISAGKGAVGLVEAVRRGGGWSYLKLTPSHLRVVASEAPPNALRAACRALVVGGEALRGMDLEAWRRHDPEVIVFNEYGPTEAVVGCTVERVSPGGLPEPAGELTIGRPCAGLTARVVDSGLMPVAVGVAGELTVAGSGLARGYLGRPAETAAAFVPDPGAAKAGERLYKTGDRARWLADGRLGFLGRLDDQVKVRGHRVELGEVEAILAAQPGVERAAVAVQDAGGDPWLAGYFVPMPGVPPDPAGLLDGLRRFLLEAMVPALLLAVPNIPLTPHGKVDRGALPAPARRRREPPAGDGARDDLEQSLVALWEDLLRTSPVGVRDDFFEIGGHSLLAVRLLDRIEADWGVRLVLADLLEGCTIERAASLIRVGGNTEERSDVVLRGGVGSPFFLIHPAGGGILCYGPLARSLGAGPPIVGLRSAGLAPDGVASGGVEDIATRHLERVRERQAEGPYRLGGWSTGGVVAYEMARRLVAAGEEVALLVLVDSHLPAYSGRAVRRASVREFALDLGLPPERIDALAAGLESLDPVESIERMLATGKASGTFHPDLSESEVVRAYSGYAAMVDAVQRFRPEPFAGAAVYFAATDSPRVLADPVPVWRALCRGGLDVHPVQGGHFDLVREPAVLELARLLAPRLEDRVGAPEGRRMPTGYNLEEIRE